MFITSGIAMARPMVFSIKKASFTTGLSEAPNPNDKGNKPLSYLKEFYMKVHPDLFSGNELHRKVNQGSLATLNSILDYTSLVRKCSQVSRFDDRGLNTPPANQTLTFYSQFTAEGNDTHATKLVEGKLDLPLGIVRTPDQAKHVLIMFDAFLGKLIIQSGVPVPEMTQIHWKALGTNPESKAVRDARSLGSSRAARRRAARARQEEMTEFKNYMFSRKKMEPRRMTDPKFTLIPAMQQSGLIRFTSTLTFVERTRAMFKFTDAVHAYWEEMGCSQWAGCAVHFHDRGQFYPPVGGIFMIPWDFNTEKLVVYFMDQTQNAIAPHLRDDVKKVKEERTEQIAADTSELGGELNHRRERRRTSRIVATKNAEILQTGDAAQAHTQRRRRRGSHSAPDAFPEKQVDDSG